MRHSAFSLETWDLLNHHARLVGSEGLVFTEIWYEFVGGYENFILSNGQMDEYPTENLVDKSDANEAIREYFKSGKMLESLNWIEQ